MFERMLNIEQGTPLTAVRQGMMKGGLNGLVPIQICLASMNYSKSLETSIVRFPLCKKQSLLWTID
jgi:hypothetical protein